jgi:hypothetical protein
MYAVASESSQNLNNMAQDIMVSGVGIIHNIT